MEPPPDPGETNMSGGLFARLWWILPVLLFGVIGFVIVNTWGWDGRPDRPSYIKMTDGKTLYCVDTESYGWGVSGWRCTRADGSSVSVPKEQVRQVVYP